jgi:hypothetical protein
LKNSTFLNINLEAYFSFALNGIWNFNGWNIFLFAFSWLSGYYILSLIHSVWLHTLINLSYAILRPPAQLGSNEWMMIIIFSIGFGLDKVHCLSAIMLLDIF